jgi:hypothetical protein
VSQSLPKGHTRIHDVIYAPAVTRPRTVRRRSGALVAVLAGALVTSACGGGSSSVKAQLPGQTHHTPYSASHHDFRAVRALLGDRARAVLHHDETAFMATVDPRSPALVRQQRILFENMSQLRLSSLRYVMDPSSQLVPAAVAGGPAFRPEVFEYLQIAGTMDHPVTNALEQTFVEDGSRWVLGAETTTHDTDAFDAAQERPWFGVATRAERLGQLTVVVDRSEGQSLGPLAAAIHADIQFDADKLGISPSYRLLVDATSNGNATTFSSLSTEQAGAVTFAVTEADPRDTTSFKAIAGHVIKVNPHHAGSYAADPGLLRHELTHFLLHSYTGVNPKWLVEGVATWMQYYPDTFAEHSVTPAFYHRLMSAPRELPSIGLFNTDPDVNYQIAQAAVAWLVKEYGMPDLLELMKAYRDHYQDVDSDALTPRMLRLVYGIDEQQVVAGAFGLLAEYQH